MTKYPKDLIPVVNATLAEMQRREHQKPVPLPSAKILQTLLDIAYHASFETEEGRRPGFRIIYYLPAEHQAVTEKVAAAKHFYNGFRLVPFDRDRAYTVSEINRLAPAAELKRLLICVCADTAAKKASDLRIWGLLDVGENWWKFVHHEASGGQPPPNFLTVSSTGPGEISLSAQGDILASLKGGEIFLPASDALWHGPLSEFFDDARGQLYQDVIQELKTKKFDPDGHDDDYPSRFYNYFLERLLFYVRVRGHGGTVIMVPSYLTRDDPRLTDRINIKYPCGYHYAWDLLVRTLVNRRKFSGLHLALWEGKTRLTQELFQEDHLLEGEKEELDEAVGDVAQAIASLTSVDGAVLMTDRFEVLGFGGEVIAVSPSLSEVQAISGPQQWTAIPIESFGTRHRSAFRFCSTLQESVGFIVSQDGGVKAVKRVGRDVALWPDINAGAMGI